MREACFVSSRLLVTTDAPMPSAWFGSDPTSRRVGQWRVRGRERWSVVSAHRVELEFHFCSRAPRPRFGGKGRGPDRARRRGGTSSLWSSWQHHVATFRKPSSRGKVGFSASTVREAAHVLFKQLQSGSCRVAQPGAQADPRKRAPHAYSVRLAQRWATHAAPV